MERTRLSPCLVACTLKSIGSIFEDSGWTSALVKADVESSRTADSLLSATNVTRMHKAHQVTACSLFQLLKEAYSSFIHEHSDSDDEASSFEDWCENQKNEIPPVSYSEHGVSNLPSSTCF